MTTSALGLIVIKHWEGELTYAVERSQYRIHDGRMGIQIVGFDPMPDHPLEMLGGPIMTIWFPCSDSLESLQGSSVRIPRQAAQQPNLKVYASLYVSEHFLCDNAIMEFNQDGSVRIKTECEDIEYYDRRAKNNKIEINVRKLSYSDEVDDLYSRRDLS